MTPKALKLVAGAGGVLAVILLIWTPFFNNGLLGKYFVFLAGIISGILLLSIINSRNKQALIVASILTALAVLSMFLT